MRVQGSSNPNVLRAPPTAADVAFVAGTGLDPIGQILSVVTNYENLDIRTINGYDIGLNYALSDTAIGDFAFNLNFTRTLEHFQSPSPVQQQLLDAQAAGTINPDAAIGGAADLLQDGGNPKSKWYASANWYKENWGAGVTGQFTDRVYEFNVRNPDGEPWEVESYLAIGIHGEYRFTTGMADNMTVRVGVRNLTDEAPPLASSGYLGNLYQPYGRQWYIRINKIFE
jgi:outer membrane receptor protein involved in Fe transport